MNKLPTAEELLNNYRFKAGEHIGNSDFDLMMEYAKKFAEIHVEAALKEASEKAEINFHDKTDGVTNVSRWRENDLESITINQESILNAYPKENIK